MNPNKTAVITLEQNGQNDAQLADTIRIKWEAIAPMGDILPGLSTPSPDQLRLLSRIILASFGINPLERSDAVMGEVTVNIPFAISRHEPNFDRLRTPEFLRDEGITNRVELVAILDFNRNQTRRLTVNLYRNLVGLAAVIFDEQINELSGRQISVHFLVNNAQYPGQSYMQGDLLAWLIGWNVQGVRTGSAREKIWIDYRCPSQDRRQLIFGAFFRRFFKPLFSNRKKPLKPAQSGSEPAAQNGRDD
jgi:hypothetical protein